MHKVPLTGDKEFSKGRSGCSASLGPHRPAGSDRGVDGCLAVVMVGVVVVVAGRRRAEGGKASVSQPQPGPVTGGKGSLVGTRDCRSLS